MIPDFDSMSLMDEAKKVVELMTGIKQQFVDAGWSEPVAEQFTLQIAKGQS